MSLVLHLQRGRSPQKYSMVTPWVSEMVVLILYVHITLSVLEQRGFFCRWPWSLGLNISADGTCGCILNLIYRSQLRSVKKREEWGCPVTRTGGWGTGWSGDENGTAWSWWRGHKTELSAKWEREQVKERITVIVVQDVGMSFFNGSCFIGTSALSTIK